MEIKQTIVVAKYLNMRKGKIAAQVAHASIKVVLDAARMADTAAGHELRIPVCPQWHAWITGSFKKIVVSVDSEEQLLAVHERAKAAGIPTALITDNGLTEFHGVPTHTTVALGPWDSAAIDAITAGLSLL